MKKLFIMLLASLLLLCACEKEPSEPVKEDEKEPVSQEQIDNFNSSEDKLVEEVPEEPEKDPVEEACVAEVRGMWLGGQKDEWKSEGFSATPGNVHLLEDGVFSYNFIIETGDIIFSFPAKGVVSFKDMENFRPEKQGDHVLASWGGEGVLENGTRFFMTLGKVVFVDENFELVGQILLPENDYYHVWPMSVALTDENGYYIPVCQIPKDGKAPSGKGVIYTYDSNFEQVSKIGDFPIPYGSFGENALPKFSENSYFYEFEGREYLSSALEYDLEKTEGYVLSEYSENIYDKDYSVTYASGKKYDPENPDSPSSKFIILKKNGKIENYIEVENFYPLGYDENGNVAATLSVSDSGKKAVVTSEFYHREIALDFRKKTLEAEYAFEDEHLSKAFDVTEDKIYSLHEASYTSGGDGFGFSVVLRNAETGELSYMFDGGVGTYCGFLKNGEIYYKTQTALRIYDPATKELTFSLEEKFPFNAESVNGDYRCLLAFRRDPENMSYTILYWEGSSDQVYGENGAEPPCYKIAFFDAEGNLLKTVKSDIPVALGMHSWPQEAVLYYNDGKYTVTTLGSKGDNGINFEFTPATEEFSKPKKNK